jgi:DNA-binding SARP family transcriptional activator
MVELLDALVASDEAAHASIVRLLGTPRISTADQLVEVPDGCARLLVYVALHPAGVQRRTAAGTLWPVGDDGRAAGNLRTALWRLNAAAPDLISADKTDLRLAPEVAVDLHVLSAWALRLIAGCPRDTDLAVVPRDVDSFELLPGWYEDWALVERERFRHRMLHGVEALSRRRCDEGHWAQAVDLAMSVVAADPLRESAQRVLIEAHLAEGNLGEARRSYRLYRNLLRRELGVDPAPNLTTLVFPWSPVEGRPPLPRRAPRSAPAGLGARASGSGSDGGA